MLLFRYRKGDDKTSGNPNPNPAMRILFVHERLGALAGAESNILAVGAELRRRGHGVGLVHGAATGFAEAAWREIFEPRFAIGGAGSAMAVRAAVAAHEPDVVFLHRMTDLSVIEALSSGAPPVARMVHDHDMYCMRGYKYRYFSRQICTRGASPYCVFPCGAVIGRGPGGLRPFKWVGYAAKIREISLNRRFARLIVASSYMRDELLRNGFDPKRIETHAPVPRGLPDAAPGAPSGGNLIVYSGQIVRGKGVDVLLEALARVRIPFECEILGDGRQRAACEAMALRLGLGGRVQFRGFVSQAEVMNTYRRATLAVMSSVWPEPFGAAGIEAMRSGLPVVAFDAGGIREWLIDGENGFLVPWMDRDRFAQRVETLLLDKPLARRLGESGRRWADERFSFEGYINGLEGLLARVAAGSPAPVTS